MATSATQSSDVQEAGPCIAAATPAMPSREVPENQREPFLQFISSIFVRNNALILGWCAQHKSSRNCQGGDCANDPKRIPIPRDFHSWCHVLFQVSGQLQLHSSHLQKAHREWDVVFSTAITYPGHLPGLSLAFQILCFVRSVPFFATMSCFRFPGRHVRPPVSRIGAEAHAEFLEFLSGTAA
jgi:hypothetical protein